MADLWLPVWVAFVHHSCGRITFGTLGLGFERVFDGLRLAACVHIPFSAEAVLQRSFLGLLLCLHGKVLRLVDGFRFSGVCQMMVLVPFACICHEPIMRLDAFPRCSQLNNPYFFS